MVKKGDTLIEVTLAVGIFSMIAIAIVAVMSNGTAGAQTALETTLAREEIDAQAEALRFIHDAAAADKDSANSNSRDDNSSFYNLWNKYIVKDAHSTREDVTKDITITYLLDSKPYDTKADLEMAVNELNDGTHQVKYKVSYKKDSTSSPITTTSLSRSIIITKNSDDNQNKEETN